MKPVKKDVPRQKRREKTLARLESYLQGGVRTVSTKPEGKIVGYDRVGNPVYKYRGRDVGTQVEFTTQDRIRIEGEITTLKQRLGRQ